MSTFATIRRQPALALVPGAALAVGLVWLAAPAPDRAGAWWAFALGAAVGELVVLHRLRGRGAATSLAVLGGFALLGNPPWMLAVVAATGWILAASVRSVRAERHLAPTGLCYRLVGAWSLAGLAALGRVLAPGLVVGHGVPVHLLAVVAVGAGIVIGAPLWDGARTAPADRFFTAFLGELEQGWANTVALASSAALAALAYVLLGAGSLVLVLFPVLAVQVGMNRYNDIRRTYQQTVMAMSRMTELTGHVPVGHGPRVAQLAAAVARELGLSEREVALVERAGYLHEVGRLSTDDPERAAHDREVALVGAAIVRAAGSMPEVVEVIERHHEPPRLGTPGPTLAACIVRSTCEFDRARSSHAEAREVLEWLQRRPDHDLMVLAALSRTLAARERFAEVEEEGCTP